MTDRMPLPANAERVLRLLMERGSTKVKEMAPVLGVTEQTVFRMAKTLGERGFISTALDGIKTILPAGREWLVGREEELDVEPCLPIDALEHAAGQLHQIGIELGLCEVVARKYGIDRCGLGSLLVIGGPSSCKTGIGEGVILLSGGGKLIEIALPGGRDLLLRRDSRGVEVMRCELLEELVVVFDELDKVKDSVIRNTIEQLYMHGTAKVTLPDTEITVGVTTVATMNPRAPRSEGFEAWTGLHDSLERRVVLIDLTDWRAPDQLLEKKDWREAMAAADAGRTIKLPAPRNPTLNVALRFKNTLSQIVRDPGVSLDERRIDFRLWSNLAAAATAWFETDEEAFRFIVWAWARISERRFPLFEDWEVRLKMIFAPKKTAREIEEERWNREVIALLKAVQTAMKGDLRLAKRLVENTPLRALGWIVRKKLGGNYERAKRLLELGAWLEKKGVSIETVRGLASLAAVIGVGNSPAGARYLMKLGNEEYDAGRRITDAAGRPLPKWPDPFTPAES